jgi:hypothetical protein
MSTKWAIEVPRVLGRNDSADKWTIYATRPSKIEAHEYARLMRQQRKLGDYRVRKIRETPVRRDEWTIR